MRFERFPMVVVLLLDAGVSDSPDVWSVSDHGQHYRHRIGS